MNLLGRYKRLQIFNLYLYALVFYIVPLISLVIFIIDQLKVNRTEMVFWIIFLISPIPCGLIGVALSAIGFVKAFRKKSNVNKVIGIFSLAFGIGSLIAGSFGLMFIYVVVK